MKLEPVKKYTFVGDDFHGTYEEYPCSSFGDRRHLNITLNHETERPTDPEEAMDWLQDSPASALFSSCTEEGEIDRLAAAAKIALRAIQAKE